MFICVQTENPYAIIQWKGGEEQSDYLGQQVAAKVVQIRQWRVAGDK